MHLSATFKKANAPYNVFNVIAGIQTTGVTLKTGSKVAIAPSRNYTRLDISVDPSTGGLLYWTSDATVSATNLVGFPIQNGDSFTWQGEGGMKGIPLPPIYFDVDTDDLLVHFNYQ